MATNPYSTQAISGFNTSPPPDGGEQTAANEITWAKHKTKLADPVRVLAQAINTEMVSAGAKLINTDANEDNAMAGALAFTISELTIASGSVTATRSNHTIDTESDAASDDLDTIGVGSLSDGALLFIRAINTGRTVVVKHNTGNIQLWNAADYTLDDDIKSLFLIRRGTDFHEMARSAVPVATQAQMETATATDVLVNPALLHQHPAVAKAWGKISGDGTGIDGTARNLGTIDDDATGLVGINFSTNMSSVNYSCGATAFTTTDGASVRVVAQVAGSFDVTCENQAGVDIDPTDSYQVWAFGDL